MRPIFRKIALVIAFVGLGLIDSPTLAKGECQADGSRDLTALDASPSVAITDWLDRIRLDHGGLEKVITREGSGFRLKTPAPRSPSDTKGALPRRAANYLWPAVSDFRLTGDFEVTWDYQVRRIGDADGKSPFEANAEVSVYGNSRFSIYGINVNNDAGGKTFKVVRFEPTLTGTHFNLISFPRTSDQGTITMRRVGTDLIFLVSQSPGQIPVELVRLPYQRAEEPSLRLSAYQGTGTRPMEVDVLFDNLSIKGASLAPLSPLPKPGKESTAPRALPAEIDYTGRAAQILSQFRETNDQAGAIVEEAAELRVRPPKLGGNGSANPQTYWYRESEFTLEGDFDISTRYDVTSLDPHPKLGYGSVNVGIGLETHQSVGSITFGRGAERGSGQKFRITRFHPTQAGFHWDTLSFPARTEKGMITLRKTGETLVFLAQEDGSPEVELFRCPALQSAPVKLRISTDQGGTPEGKVDLRLSELKVRAESFGHPGKRGGSLFSSDSPTRSGPDFTVPPETPSPRLQMFAVLGFGIALCLMLAGFWAWWRSRTPISVQAVAANGSTPQTAAVPGSPSPGGVSTPSPLAKANRPVPPPTAKTAPKQPENAPVHPKLASAPGQPKHQPGSQT